MIADFFNQSDSLTVSAGDIFIPKSLPQGKDTLSLQDSLWNTLQTSLFGDRSLLDKQEEIHFLIQEQAKTFEDSPYLHSGFDWFFILALSFLLLLAFIRLRSSKTFSTSYEALTKGKFIENSYDSQNSFSKRLSLPLFICSWIGLSSILYIFSLFYTNYYYRLFDLDKNSVLLFSVILIAIYFAIRYFLYQSVSLLFNIKNIISEYQYLQTRMEFVVVILSFPFVFIYAYYCSPSMLSEKNSLHVYILLIIIALIFIILFTHKIIQGWGIFKRKFRLHEYFLYLCTIEILPLFIFVKFAINTLQTG